MTDDQFSREWANWKDIGFPELRRGMTISVERPWSWSHPLSSALAVGITRVSALILGKPVEVEHKMIYLGRGRALSQGPEFDIVPLADYAGCVLRFRHNPAWTQDQRNALVADAACYRGEKYGYGDLVAFLAKALRHPASVVEGLQDHRWVCSEAVAALVRRIEPGYGGPGGIDLVLPKTLDDWEDAQGWPCLTVRVI